MSLASIPTAMQPTAVLTARSAGNTAAATSAWIPVSNYEGVVSVHINVGTITGSVVFSFRTNDQASGTGATSITPLNGALPTITTANDDAVYVAHFDARQLRGYIEVTGTITTGPALLAYTLVGRTKVV